MATQTTNRAPKLVAPAKVETASALTALADNQLVIKCRTRVDENSTEKVTTNLTITFDDDKATREFAKRGIVIAWQALARITGVIPESDTVSVAELIKRSGGGGFKATPQSIAARVGKMTDDDYRATLVGLGVNAADVTRLMKSRTTK